MAGSSGDVIADGSCDRCRLLVLGGLPDRRTGVDALEKAGYVDRLTLRMERRARQEVHPIHVREAVLAIYPELRTSVEGSALEVSIKPVERLDTRAKAHRVIDHRRSWREGQIRAATECDQSAGHGSFPSWWRHDNWTTEAENVSRDSGSA